MVHRGQILENYIRKANVNITKLADLLPWTSKTIYRHFREEDLSYGHLVKYSKALKYDFREELPELEGSIWRFHEPQLPYKKDADTDAEYYRKKYEELLERHNFLLERYNLLLQSKG